MNCRKGDVARIVGLEDEDHFVTCLEYVETPVLSGVPAFERDCWRIDRPIRWSRPATGAEFLAPYCPDKYLRPIRDSDAPDEMIERIGKPEAVTA